MIFDKTMNHIVSKKQRFQIVRFINFEAVAIITAQAIICPEPDEPFGVLQHTIDFIRHQTIHFAERVLENMLIKCLLCFCYKKRAKQKNKIEYKLQFCHTNFSSGIKSDTIYKSIQNQLFFYLSLFA